jgi:RecJ-like exonuclease
MIRIVECWRCDGSGYVEACYECAHCGGCGTTVEEDEDFDEALTDFIDEEA